MGWRSRRPFSLNRRLYLHFTGVGEAVLVSQVEVLGAKTTNERLFNEVCRIVGAVSVADQASVAQHEAFPRRVVASTDDRHAFDVSGTGCPKLVLRHLHGHGAFNVLTTSKFCRREGSLSIAEPNCLLRWCTTCDLPL